MTIIGSTHYAIVDDTPQGICVTVWRAGSAQRAAKRIEQWILDCPFHIACDSVHALLQTGRRVAR